MLFSASVKRAVLQTRGRPECACEQGKLTKKLNFIFFQIRLGLLHRMNFNMFEVAEASFEKIGVPLFSRTIEPQFFRNSTCAGAHSSPVVPYADKIIWQVVRCWTECFEYLELSEQI